MSESLHQQEPSFYCVPCKKKFGSESTFANHQKSSKHLQQIKKQGIFSPPKTKNVVASIKSPNISPQKELPNTVTEVIEAELALQEAKNKAKKQPNQAIKLALNSGKILANHQRVTDAIIAFELLLQLVHGQPDASNIRNIMLKHRAYITLGKLHTSFDMSMATNYILKAVYCLIPESFFQQMGESVSFKELSQGAIDIHQKVVQPLVNIYTANASGKFETMLLDTLNEAGKILPFGSKQSLLFYILSAEIAKKETSNEEAIVALLGASKTYYAMNLPFWAMDCIKEVASLNPITADQYLCQVIEESLFFGDMIRVKNAIKALHQYSSISPKAKFLSSLAEAFELKSCELLEEIFVKFEEILHKETRLLQIYKIARDKVNG